MITQPQFQSNAPGAGVMGQELTAEALAKQIEGALTDAQAAQAKEDARLETLFSRLYGFFKEEQGRQAASRFQMALDEDYFDSLQWDEDEIRKLTARNQAALVYNAIKPMVLWLTGTEKRTRIDYKVVPRKDDPNEAQEAEAKTKTLKYIDDVNMSSFATSQAFKEAAISGLSWLEDGATNNPQEMPVYGGWESWKNVLHDTAGNDFFGKDWRYLFRWREMDEDIAVAMFPEFEDHIAQQCTEYGKPLSEESGWYLGTKRDSTDWPSPGTTGVGRRNFIDLGTAFKTARKRLRIVEAWYRVPTRCYVCKGTIFDGETYDAKNSTMKQAFEGGAIMLVNQVAFEMRVAFMTDQKILSDAKSPYKHNDFPFTPVWCYRRGRDGAPYGVVREQRDPQDSLNKHMSKAQWHLAANQIIAGKDVITDWKSARRNADKANGTIILDGPNSAAGRFEINRGTDKAAQHVEMAKFDMSVMRENYGLNTDNFGIQSNAQSGRAIHARQEQGSIQSQNIFDNLRLAHQLRGEKRLSLAEQFITEEKQIRVAGDKQGKWDYTTINKPTQNPDGTWRYENDITATKADFIVDEQDYHASVRQAMAESMADMISKMPPEVAFKFLDMWVEMLDIPNKEEYLKRIRALNGMGDENDPNQAAVKQAQAQAQQQVQMVQQQAEKVVKTLDGKVEALSKENQALRASLDQKVTMLANKAEELKLRRIEIDNQHSEAIAQIELDREQGRQAAATADAASRQKLTDQANQHADKAKAAETAKHDTQSKDLQEFLANVEQSIVEFRALAEKASPQTYQLVVPPGALNVNATMAAPAKQGKTITLPNGQVAKVAYDPSEPAAPPVEPAAPVAPAPPPASPEPPTEPQ